MKITRKSDYGLRALCSLARNYQGDPVSIAQLSAEHGIPDPFLEKIMQELREANLVEAAHGRGGGYYLNRRPTQISVKEIIEALEGPVALVTCLDPKLKCAIESGCPTSPIWETINERFERCLDDLTLEAILSVRIETVKAS